MPKYMSPFALALAALALSGFPIATCFSPSYVQTISRRAVFSRDTVTFTPTSPFSDEPKTCKLNRCRCVRPLPMLPSFLSLNSFSPSLLFSYEETAPAYQAEEAFQDQVNLVVLTSDPALQAAFVASAVAIIILFVAKSVVSQMDAAVEEVALEFDRVMKSKYAKKWSKFMVEGVDSTGKTKEEIEADRVQRIVEGMERLTEEEPEFVERVIGDIKRWEQ